MADLEQGLLSRIRQQFEAQVKAKMTDIAMAKARSEPPPGTTCTSISIQGSASYTVPSDNAAIEFEVTNDANDFEVEEAKEALSPPISVGPTQIMSCSKLCSTKLGSDSYSISRSFPITYDEDEALLNQVKVGDTTYTVTAQKKSTLVFSLAFTVSVEYFNCKTGGVEVSFLAPRLKDRLRDRLDTSSNLGVLTGAPDVALG